MHRKSLVAMTDAEQGAGWFFFLFYFTVFPFLTAWAGRILVEKWDVLLSETTISLCIICFFTSYHRYPVPTGFCASLFGIRTANRHKPEGGSFGTVSISRQSVC
jgi:hypothetical protein